MPVVESENLIEGGGVSCGCPTRSNPNEEWNVSGNPDFDRVILNASGTTWSRPP